MQKCYFWGVLATHFACITINHLVFKTEQHCKMAKKAELVPGCSFNEISFIIDSHWTNQGFMAIRSDIKVDCSSTKKSTLD